MDTYETNHMISEALRLAELISEGEITQEVAVDRLFEFTEGGITKETASEVIVNYLELYKFGTASGFLGKA